MNNILFAAILLASIVSGASAQDRVEKGLASISSEAAMNHIEFLACNELGGREAGTLQSRIAARYLENQLRAMGIRPLFEKYRHAFVACRAERQQRGRWEVHRDSVERLQSGVHREMQLQNVLGFIPGKLANEYVIIGTHYDHLGIDARLKPDSIYNGADDNASGVSAVLQIAKAFSSLGQQPLRNVIFAFWDGEEYGLLGSKHFLLHWLEGHPLPLGYLNFDMIGRNSNEQEPEAVTFFYTESHPAFGEWLKQDIARYELKLKPDYRAWDKPVSGSDNASFALHGVPIIWYHTGGHPDYHKPSDHSNLINAEKVMNITKAAFLNAWHLANDKKY